MLALSPGPGTSAPRRSRVRRRGCVRSLLTLAALACGLSAEATAQPRSPNIVLILADDMGYGDVGAYNPRGKIPTPHMDRLAREGLRFTDAHSPSAVCTPTRYGLLTGRYAWRTRLARGVLWGNGDALIEPGRMTLASLLRTRGYRTAAVGKWHLGVHWAAREGATADRTTNSDAAALDWIDYTRPVAGGPVHHGFDEFFGIPASLDMRDYVYLEGDRVVEAPTSSLPGASMQVPAFHRPGRAGPSFRPERVLADLRDRATRFVRERARSTSPFFLYLPLASPHTPVLPTGRFAGLTGLGPYADFVAETDAVVGEVLRALDETGRANDTLVIVTSDNGPAPVANLIADLRAKGHDSAGGWRGAKHDLFEGGHRVPFLVRWPGVVAAGRTSSATIGLVDVLATLADVVGERLPDGAGEDSVSFLRALKAPGESFKRGAALVMQSGNGSFAVREGRWKLLLAAGSGGQSPPRPGAEEQGLPPVQLYDLEADPAETTNLQARRPDVVRTLSAALDTFRAARRSRP